MSTASQKYLSVYIDGFNLYHAVDATGKDYLKWINLMTLASSFLKTDEKIRDVVFFTAITTWGIEKQQRHNTYIDALRGVGVEVVESNFRKVKKYCKQHNWHCKRYEEKQTDVAIAVRIIADASKEKFTRMILVTADSDQIPLIKFMKSTHPSKKITLAAPPDRGKDARELGAVVHERRPLSLGRLGTCLLPRDVYDLAGKKVATRPAKYAR